MKKMKKIVVTLFATITLIIISGITSKATTVKITIDDLNVREEPSKDSNVFVTVSTGEEYTLLSEEDEWYKIKYEDDIGYISKDYAEIVEEDTEKNETENDKSENDETEDKKDEENNENDNKVDENADKNEDTTKQENDNTTSNTQNTESTSNTGKMIKNDKARILPLINATVLQTLNSGTNVTIISEINGWSYVATDKISAWVRTSNIKKGETTGNSSTEDNNKDEEKNDNNKTDSNKVDNENTNNNKTDNNKTENNDDTKDDNKTFTKKTMYVNDSYVNIRTEPSTSSDVLMVVALNTELTVIGEEGDWYKVNTSEGEAYILKELLSEEMVSATSRGGVITRGATENISAKDLENPEKQKATNTSNNDTSSNSTSNNNANVSEKGEKIVAYAKKFLGVPYVYGGASPSGFDCSGFTMYVFDNFGIDMAHGAQNQAELGKEIKTDKSSSSSIKNNLQPGDLVFFLDYETMDEIGHCGIYIGDGNFIHASSGTGYCVKIDSLLPGEYYNTRYCEARRVI